MGLYINLFACIGNSEKVGVPQTLCVPIQKSQPFHDVGCPIFSHSFLEYLCMVYMIHSCWSQTNPAAEVITFGFFGLSENMVPNVILMIMFLI